MPILQKDGQNTTFVEEDHRSYHWGPQMYDITDVAGHEMSSIFISVWVKIDTSPQLKHNYQIHTLKCPHC